MKKNFSSISERDISGFSDRDLEQEIKRRNQIQGYLLGIFVLPSSLLVIKLVWEAYKEEDVLSFVLGFVIMGILHLIQKILENIKPLRTEHLEKQLEKRRRKRQKERETEKILYNMTNGDFTVKARQALIREIFQISLEDGAIRIIPTAEKTVKILIPASTKDRELREISNNEVLKYFQMQEDD